MNRIDPLRNLLKRWAGFSLIEVVIALGIISFCMIGVLGLIALSANYSGQSSRETAFALMAQSTISNLRSRGFSLINTPALPTQGTLDDATPDFYYDVNGRVALKSDGTVDTSPHSDSIYGCTVTRYSPNNQTSANVIFLRLEFSWPIVAPAVNRQKIDVYTSISNSNEY